MNSENDICELNLKNSFFASSCFIKKLGRLGKYFFSNVYCISLFNNLLKFSHIGVYCDQFAFFALRKVGMTNYRNGLQ